MLRSVGQQRLYLRRPVYGGVGHRYARHGPQDFGQFVVGRRTRCAVKKLEVDDPAGGNAPTKQERFDNFPYLRTSTASCERALVRQVSRHIS